MDCDIRITSSHFKYASTAIYKSYGQVLTRKGALGTVTMMSCQNVSQDANYESLLRYLQLTLNCDISGYLGSRYQEFDMATSSV